ncbi:hypothetical protein DL764_007652 [Monosporascus ibericus]|uniref:Uncharacterized protein n=1 Tax=Monosporascus ibericus TaxID=155417 RepID=A0A4Q4T2L0_9PEZI|nr:hypothetical protein DL764_007652 [Monosporascus ibericus]
MSSPASADTSSSSTLLNAWAATHQALQDLNESRSRVSYPNCWASYDAESALGDPVGVTSAVASRRMGRAAVADFAAIRATLEAVTGGGDGREKQEQAVVVVAAAVGLCRKGQHVPGDAWRV